jgi:uncharacterized protein (DUF305 family)
MRKGAVMISRLHGYRLLLVLLMAWLMSGPALGQPPENPAGNSSPQGEETYQSLTALQGRDFDRAFLSIMLVHRQVAIKMSRAAVPRVRDRGVQSWAVALVKTETSQRDRIAHHLNQIGGPDTKDADLAKVEFARTFLTTGEVSTADRTFLQQMAVHQVSAVAMGRLALKRSHDARVLALARENLRSDAERLRELRSRLHDHPT